MNDRFKFRFWHKSKNHYINTEKLVLNDGTYTQVGTKQMNNGTYCSYIVNEYNTSDIIPEQCTGLKDKNGKLIYENDVLKLIDQGIEYEVSVYWESGMYCFAITPNSANLVFSDLSDNETTCEIIGNIHENEDLLENEE